MVFSRVTGLFGIRSDRRGKNSLPHGSGTTLRTQREDGSLASARRRLDGLAQVRSKALEEAAKGGLS